MDIPDEKRQKIYYEVAAAMHKNGYYAVSPAAVAKVDQDLQNGCQPADLVSQSMAAMVEQMLAE